MAAAKRKPTLDETEQRLRVLAVRMATVLAEHAARLTNLELFLKARNSVNQQAATALPPFSRPGYLMVVEMVRNEILAELFPSEEEAEEVVANGPAVPP